MIVYPTNLKTSEDNHLQIDWSDGKTRRYSFRHLRDACPCATCREKRGSPAETPSDLLPVLRPEDTQPLKINAMKPVGSYAYTIAFSDGHDTGIFSFEFLRSLGEGIET